MILRKNSVNKSDELAAGLQLESGNIDETDLVVQLVHMLRTLIQIYDTAVSILHLGVYLVK